MAGIPPIAGFFAKLGIIMSLTSAKSITLPLIVVVLSCIGCYYYIRLIKVLYFVKQSSNTFHLFDSSRLIDFVLVFFTLIILVFALRSDLLFKLVAFASISVMNS
jgi:NADH-quinone oxidoreductase subunit N